jgi:hypothetical protein
MRELADAVDSSVVLASAGTAVFFGVADAAGTTLVGLCVEDDAACLHAANRTVRHMNTRKLFFIIALLLFSPGPFP